MKLTRLLLLPIATITLVVGCKKDDFSINSSTANKKQGLVEVAINQKSKVSFTPHKDGLKLAWEEDDSISIYKASGEKWGDYSLVSIDESSGSATFSGPELETGISYVTTYPASSQLTLDKREGAKVKTTRQKINSNFDHLDQACLMESSPFTKGENIVLSHQMAILSLTHTSKIEPMAIEVGYGDNNPSNNTIVSVSNGENQTPITTINLLVHPKAASSQLKVYIYSPNNQCYIYERESTKEFVAGGHYTGSIGDYTTLKSTTNTANEVELLKQRVVTSLVANNEKNVYITNLYNQLMANGDTAAATSLLSSLPISDEKMVETWSSMAEDGSWPSINYELQQASSWPAGNHFENSLKLATCYRNPNSEYFKDPKLLADIIKSIEYWCDNNYYCSANWYPNTISVPRGLAKTVILIQDEMSSDLLTRCKVVLNRPKVDMTGSNKILLSYNVFLRGLIYDNATDRTSANNAIKGELKVVPFGVEGLQEDFSYQLHGIQLQIANYGFGFAHTIAPWLSMVKGTSYEFEAEKINYLSTYYLKTVNAATWRGAMDIHGLGRQITPNSEVHKAITMIAPLYDMMQADPEKATEYLDMINRNFGGVHNNTFVGNFYFDDSKYLVHRSKDFCITLRMLSNEVLGGEYINDENKEGFHLADGGLFTYYKGGEYTNIMPAWNPTFVPGTTVNTTKNPSWANKVKYLQAENFVGGVSNGNVGMAIMKYSRNNIKANKTWVFLKDKVICLGNSITKLNGVSSKTTLEQNNLKEPFTYLTNGTTTTGGIGTEATTTKFINSGIGYESLDGAEINISAASGSGNWKDIATFLGDITVTKDIFRATFNHATSTSYAYTVEPGVDSQTFFNADRTRGFKVVKNDATATVVESKEENVVLAVFWDKGEVETEQFGKIMCKKPSTMLITGTKDNPTTLYGTGDGGGVATPGFGGGVTNI